MNKKVCKVLGISGHNTIHFFSIMCNRNGYEDNLFDDFRN